jgi:hypothetical protein
LATVECDVGARKQRVFNCEDTLKRKLAALTEAKKEQAKLQRTVEERDTELAKEDKMKKIAKISNTWRLGVQER